jgi:hypothetical protein
MALNVVCCGDSNTSGVEGKADVTSFTLEITLMTNTDVADARALTEYLRQAKRAKESSPLTLSAMTGLGDIMRPQMHF